METSPPKKGIAYRAQSVGRKLVPWTVQTFSGEKTAAAFIQLSDDRTIAKVVPKSSFVERRPCDLKSPHASWRFGQCRNTPIDGSAIWRDITTEIEGKTIIGTYAFSDWMITVKSLHGNKSKQLDGSNPVSLALQMLAELAEGATDNK